MPAFNSAFHPPRDSWHSVEVKRGPVYMRQIGGLRVMRPSGCGAYDPIRMRDGCSNWLDVENIERSVSVMLLPGNVRVCGLEL